MRAKRIDVNQTEIVDALRDNGCSVAITSSLGNGFPDIVVAKDKRTVLMEIKDGEKCPSQQKLTIKEARFIEDWRGEVYIVKDVFEALEIMQSVLCGTWKHNHPDPLDIKSLTEAMLNDPRN